jgi:hypothetical protein
MHSLVELITNEIRYAIGNILFIVFLNWASILDQCVVQGGSKNKYHTYTCLKKIGLYLQMALTTPHMGGPRYLIQIPTNMRFQ